MRPLVALLVLILFLPVSLQAQSVPDAETQIETAVQAAPESMRETATVLGYTDDQTLTTLRDGSGPLVCLADDPTADDFHVACYHESLAPFMKRGRELRREGVTAVDSVRRTEIESGSLSYPDQPATLYNLSGSYDPSTNEIEDASRLHVVYVPYATGSDTGLPTRPEGGPWLMNPGEPWAHIMISNP